VLLSVAVSKTGKKMKMPAKTTSDTNMADTESNKGPAGRTTPAGQKPASPAGEDRPLLRDAGETWARSRLEWTCLNALEMRRRELLLVLGDLDVAVGRLRGRG
jgi:hypothetical protein